MTFFGQWLGGFLACAAIVSLLERLCPDGAPRLIVRFTGGLLLLCALLRAPEGFVQPDAARRAEDWREAAARLETELRSDAQSAFADGIARKLEAYIEDKAGTMGVRVRASVTMGERDGVPVPERVTLRGAYSAALSDVIASELGIAKEKQTWIDSG